MNRREFVCIAAAGGLASAAVPVLAGEEKLHFKIGACDWSLGRCKASPHSIWPNRSDWTAFSSTSAMPARQTICASPRTATSSLRLSRETGIAIAALAMLQLNSTPLATEDRSEAAVGDCIEVMPKMGQKLVLLPFFGAGDIKGKPQSQTQLIARLKRLAPKAEKAGVVLGIESYLNAEEHLRIIDAVGSPAVGVYYDVCNMADKRYDVPADIRKLKGQIRQVHCKENGRLLGQGQLDFPAIKKALLDIGYRGWLIIEGATVPKKSLVKCYRHNRQYLNTLFNN